MDTILDERVLPGNTDGMKFAISVPDDVFQAVEAQAEKMGISRSQFYADAARAYVDRLTHWEQVAEINAILEATGYDPAEDQAIANYGAAFLRATAHEWQEGDDAS